MSQVSPPHKTPSYLKIPNFKPWLDPKSIQKSKKFTFFFFSCLEHIYLSKMAYIIKKYARHPKCHIWQVENIRNPPYLFCIGLKAHPQVLQRKKNLWHVRICNFWCPAYFLMIWGSLDRYRWVLSKKKKKVKKVDFEMVLGLSQGQKNSLMVFCAGVKPGTCRPMAIGRKSTFFNFFFIIIL